MYRIVRLLTKWRPQGARAIFQEVLPIAPPYKRLWFSLCASEASGAQWNLHDGIMRDPVMAVTSAGVTSIETEWVLGVADEFKPK